MYLPKPIQDLINAFERLPGIGPKTAQRLTFYLLHFPQEELEKFGDAFKNVKANTKFCSVCKNVDEVDPCSICSDEKRDKNKIIIVTGPLDVLAFEKVGYKGNYHVLHGIINPLDNIGPDEIYIKNIIPRLKELVSSDDSAPNNIFSDAKPGEEPQEAQAELILATNSSMEGESTAMYITKLVRNRGFDETKVKITRIARGLPVGGDVEYADDITLTRALEGRSDF